MPNNSLHIPVFLLCHAQGIPFASMYRLAFYRYSDAIVCSVARRTPSTNGTAPVIHHSEYRSCLNEGRMQMQRYIPNLSAWTDRHVRKKWVFFGFLHKSQLSKSLWAVILSFSCPSFSLLSLILIPYISPPLLPVVPTLPSLRPRFWGSTIYKLTLPAKLRTRPPNDIVHVILTKVLLMWWEQF